MIELGFFSGLRVDEMRQLKIGDIHTRDNHSSIFVRNGKGGRKRNVWINAEFKEVCEEYIKLREHFNLQNNEDALVFVSNDGAPISKRSIQKSFKRCVKAAGLSKKYHIHCLRHTYATYLLKSSRNIKLVKEQLGHSSIKTTEVYITLIKEDTTEALKNLYKEPAFIKLSKPKKSRYKLKHITCEYAKSGTIGRKPYNKDNLPPGERWEEIVQICAEIILEASQRYKL